MFAISQDNLMACILILKRIHTILVNNLGPTDGAVAEGFGPGEPRFVPKLRSL